MIKHCRHGISTFIWSALRELTLHKEVKQNGKNGMTRYRSLSLVYFFVCSFVSFLNVNQ